MANTKSPESFFYIAEQTSPENMKIDPVIQKQGSVWWVEFDTCLHQFEVLGVNERQYLGDNIWSCIVDSPKIQSCLRRNCWYGEQDHPWPKLDGEKLSTKRILSIFMPNRSHIISNPYRKGDCLYGHIATCSGTEAGRGFANELVQGPGLIPTFSCRCVGGSKIINGKLTVISRILVTYDWVTYPSFSKAEMTSKAEGKTRSIMLTESGEEGLVSSNDAFIPFEELGNDLAETDPNIAAYMEAGNFDKDDILGFAGNGSHMVLQSGRDSRFYAGISSDSIERVKDFYHSFKI